MIDVTLTTTTETRTLRPRDQVLVTPSPLSAQRFHRAMTPDAPGAVWRTVHYVSAADPDVARRNWRDVVYTEGGWTSSPASSSWIVAVSQ